jgi:hypothetical protein
MRRTQNAGTCPSRLSVCADWWKRHALQYNAITRSKCRQENVHAMQFMHTVVKCSEKKKILDTMVMTHKNFNLIGQSQRSVIPTHSRVLSEWCASQKLTRLLNSNYTNVQQLTKWLNASNRMGKKKQWQKTSGRTNMHTFSFQQIK